MSDWLAEVRDREQLMQRFGVEQQGGRIVEVGVEYGLFTEQIAQLCPKAAVFAVDPWQYRSDYNDPCNTEQARQDEVYRKCCERLRPYMNVQIIRLPSLEAAAASADRRFELVYLDGDHSYKAINDDINAWYPLVAPGGILAGHDYTHNPDAAVCGVIPAVQKLVNKRGLTLHLLLDTGDCSWAVRKPL